jgi:hypothetical protein
MVIVVNPMGVEEELKEQELVRTGGELILPGRDAVAVDKNVVTGMLDVAMELVGTELLETVMILVELMGVELELDGMLLALVVCEDDKVDDGNRIFDVSNADEDKGEDEDEGNTVDVDTGVDEEDIDETVEIIVELTVEEPGGVSISKSAQLQN